jgi:TetR/AcrR family transcriptional regulator, tetracycline repressor protein
MEADRPRSRLPLLTLPSGPRGGAYAGQIVTAHDAAPSPRRGRPPSLSEDQIAEAAIRLSNRVGFEALAMRGLATELGVPVMTIYNYVPNKSALFDLISDHLLRPIPIPASDSGPWEERMRALQRSTRTAVGRHIGLRFGTGVGQSAEAARLAEGAMSILIDGGFTPEQADLAFAVLFTFMLGQIELDAIMNTSSGPDSETIIPSAERDETFEFAFDVMLEGLTQRFGRPNRERQQP